MLNLTYFSCKRCLLINEMRTGLPGGRLMKIFNQIVVFILQVFEWEQAKETH